MIDLDKIYFDEETGKKFIVPTTYYDLILAFDCIPKSIFDFNAARDRYSLVQVVQDESLNDIVRRYFDKCGSRYPRVLKIGFELEEQDYKTSLEMTVKALKRTEETLIIGSIALNKARDEFDRQVFDNQIKEFYRN